MKGGREPIGQVLPRFFMPIRIRISAPMSFERFADRRKEPIVLRQIADEIMYELRELSGQEYVNAYAKRKQAEDPAAAGAAEPARVEALVAG